MSAHICVPRRFDAKFFTQKKIQLSLVSVQKKETVIEGNNNNPSFEIC